MFSASVAVHVAAIAVVAKAAVSGVAVVVEAAAV